MGLGRYDAMVYVDICHTVVRKAKFKRPFKRNLCSLRGVRFVEAWCGQGLAASARSALAAHSERRSHGARRARRRRPRVLELYGSMSANKATFTIFCDALVSLGSGWGQLRARFYEVSDEVSAHCGNPGGLSPASK